jgi:putative transposase
MMAFVANQKMVIESVEYRLDRRLLDGVWQIENTITGVYSQRAEEELLELYRCDQLWLLVEHDDDYALSSQLGRELQANLDSYDPKQVAIAKLYANYLNAVDTALENGDIDSLSDKQLNTIIRKVAAEEGDLDPPSPATLRRRHGPWVASGRDTRSQIPRFDARGNRDRFSKPMEWLFDCAFRATFLSTHPGKRKISKAYQDLLTKIDAINSGDDAKIQKRFNEKELRRLELQQLKEQVKQSSPLEVPERSVLYRRKNKMSLYDITAAQMGQAYADRQFRITFPAPKALKPLAEVQGDETITDLFSIDEMRRLALGRARALCLFDTYIHGCYGAYIGYEPQSVLSYMNAIRHGILPKTYVAKEYPEIQNKWGIHGKARVYNFDNTMAVHAKDFEHIGFKLNSSIIFDLPETPWFKAMVERFFRDVNEQLLHQQMGTTLSRFADLAGGDYDPTKNAIIPHSLLLLIFHKYVIDIHLQTVKESINDTPAGKWESYRDAIARPLPPRASELDIILGRRLEYRIQHYGIEMEHITYQSHELGLLRRQLSRPKVHSPLVEVMSPPGNLGHIYVLDPDNGKYLKVFAQGQDYPTAGLSAWEYANGLSLWSHRLHVKYCRENLHGRMDILALAEAQAQIWDWAMSIAKLNKDIARYLEDHTRPHPTGALASHEMVLKMVEKLAGKREELPPAEPSLPVTVPQTFVDVAEDELPTFGSSRDLPALSSGPSEPVDPKNKRDIKSSPRTPSNGARGAA